MIKWVSTIEDDKVIYECEFGYIKQDEEGWIFSALGKTCRPNSKELQIEQVQKHFEHCMKSIIKRANEVLGLVWTEEQRKLSKDLKMLLAQINNSIIMNLLKFLEMDFSNKICYASVAEWNTR